MGRGPACEMSSGCDLPITLMNSLQLWLPAQDQDNKAAVTGSSGLSKRGGGWEGGLSRLFRRSGRENWRYI